MVRPSLKNGTRFALTQRWIVSVVTFSSLDSSETLKADSERVSLSASDRGEAVVADFKHRPYTLQCPSTGRRPLPFTETATVYMSWQDGSFKDPILPCRCGQHKPKPAPSTAFGPMNASDVRRIAASYRKPGDYLFRPVAYPRSVSSMAISQ
jgi:hypothetical protein